MSATQAFADRWRRSGRTAAVLAKLDILAGSSPSFSIWSSMSIMSTPDGTWWEPFIADAGTIRAPGAFGTSDVPLCSMELTLITRKVGSQASGTVVDTLATNSWIGSTVSVWLWETGLTDFATDALMVFKGTVQDYEVKPRKLLLN